MESAYAITNGLKGAAIPKLSEQQAVDCVTAPEYGSAGCNGGWMDDVFQYNLKKGNRWCTEEEYPYTARDGTCQESLCSLDVGVVGIKNIPEGDLDTLLAATEERPVAIAVDASDWSFYRAGIHKSKKTSLNHGVVLEGFHRGEGSGKDFLYVRNSWGARWGMSGFIKLDLN